MTKIISDTTEETVTKLAPASFYKILDGEKVELLGCGSFSFAYQGGDYVYTITDNSDAWKDVCSLLRLPHLPETERLLTDDKVNLYKMPKYTTITTKYHTIQSLPPDISDKTVKLIEVFTHSSGSSIESFVSINHELLADFPDLLETLYQVESLLNGEATIDWQSGNLALDADNNLILLDIFIVYREWLADEVQEKLKW